MKPLKHYSKPSAAGGTIIRKVIANFKAHGYGLPIEEPVWIATSGGADSMVLAHLISKYGRKVVDPKWVTLVHLDHGWRVASRTKEKRAVESLAKTLEVAFVSKELASPSERVSKNLEEDARLKRSQYFDQIEKIVFTAHHRDDVAETLFWRFMRGELIESMKGISFQDHKVLRPFLKVTKREILAYAKAEGVRFYEDPTNRNLKQMRGFLRTKAFPLLEKHFPGFPEKIAGYADRIEPGAMKSGETDVASVLEAVIDCRLNRHQRNQIQKSVLELKLGQEISLPGGRVLERTKNGFFLRLS